MESRDSSENVENLSPHQIVRPSPNRANKNFLGEIQNLSSNANSGSSENDVVKSCRKLKDTQPVSSPSLAAPGNYCATSFLSETPTEVRESDDVAEEDESWRERAVVLTKQDHEDYVQYAQDILDDLINSLKESSAVELDRSSDKHSKDEECAVPVFNQSLDNSSISDYESATEENKSGNISLDDTLNCRGNPAAVTEFTDPTDEAADLELHINRRSDDHHSNFNVLKVVSSAEDLKDINFVASSNLSDSADSTAQSHAVCTPEGQENDILIALSDISNREIVKPTVGQESKETGSRPSPPTQTESIGVWNNASPSPASSATHKSVGKGTSLPISISDSVSDGVGLIETTIDVVGPSVTAVVADSGLDGGENASVTLDSIHPPSGTSQFAETEAEDFGLEQSIGNLPVNDSITVDEVSLNKETFVNIGSLNALGTCSAELSDAGRAFLNVMEMEDAKEHQARSNPKTDVNEGIIDAISQQRAISKNCSSKSPMQVESEHCGPLPQIARTESHSMEVTGPESPCSGGNGVILAVDTLMESSNATEDSLGSDMAVLQATGDLLSSFETPSKVPIKPPVLNIKSDVGPLLAVSPGEEASQSLPGRGMLVANKAPSSPDMDRKFEINSCEAVPAEDKLAAGAYDVGLDSDVNPFATRSTEVASSPPLKGNRIDDCSVEDVHPFTAPSKLSFSPPKTVTANENDAKSMLDLDIIVQSKSNDSIEEVDSGCLEPGMSDKSDSPVTEATSEKTDDAVDKMTDSYQDSAYEFDLDFDPETYDPFAPHARKIDADETGARDTPQGVDENIVDASNDSFNAESEPATSNNVTVIENEDFSVELQSSIKKGEIAEALRQCSVTQDSMPASNETKESSESSGIHSFNVPSTDDHLPSSVSCRGTSLSISPDGGAAEQSCAGPSTQGLNGVVSENEDDQIPQKLHGKNEERLVENLSEAGPDIAEFNEEEFKSAVEFFKDPAAFEFLQKAGGSQNLETALARMSLYLKFDPLVKPDSPAHQKTLRTSKGPTEVETIPPAEGSHKLIEFSPSPKKNPFEGKELLEELRETKKPSKNISCSSKSKNMSEIKKNEAKMFTEDEMKMQELLFQEKLMMKDKSWNEKLTKCEKSLNEKLNALSKEKEQDHAKLNSFHESQLQMTEVIAEYEKTMSEAMAKKDVELASLQKANDELKKKKDQAVEDVQALETSFGDFYRRYEKCKDLLETLKKNEETWQETVDQCQQKLKKSEQKYELLKNHAEKTLERANQEILNVKKVAESEVMALQAQLKKSEMQRSILDRTLQDKTKEAAELSKICDELIQKVGNS